MGLISRVSSRTYRKSKTNNNLKLKMENKQAAEFYHRLQIMDTDEERKEMISLLFKNNNQNIKILQKYERENSIMKQMNEALDGRIKEEVEERLRMSKMHEDRVSELHSSLESVEKENQNLREEVERWDMKNWDNLNSSDNQKIKKLQETVDSLSSLKEDLNEKIVKLGDSNKKLIDEKEAEAKKYAEFTKIK